MNGDTATLHTMGLASLGASIGGFIISLSPIFVIVAASISGIAYALTIYESPTVQYWLMTWRQKRQAKKIMRLRAQQKVVQAKLEAMDRIHVAKNFEQAKVQAVKEAAAESLKE